MPPRPPVTTLVIHTWKEHGKPRPLSNQEQSTQAARDRISRSLSYDTHLAAHVKPSEDDMPLSTHPHCRPAVIRSTSTEEALLATRCSPVVAVASPLSSTPQLSDDDSDTSYGVLPVLPRCISNHPGAEDDLDTSPPSPEEITAPYKRHHNLSRQEGPHEALPPLPGEWPLCHRRHISKARGIPPRAVSLLLAEHLPVRGQARRVRAKSVGTGGVFESSLLGDSMIQGSSSFDAGLSDIARRGIVQSGISPNV